MRPPSKGRLRPSGICHICFSHASSTTLAQGHRQPDLRVACLGPLKSINGGAQKHMKMDNYNCNLTVLNTCNAKTPRAATTLARPIVLGHSSCAGGSVAVGSELNASVTVSPGQVRLICSERCRRRCAQSLSS